MTFLFTENTACFFVKSLTALEVLQQIQLLYYNVILDPFRVATKNILAVHLKLEMFVEQKCRNLSVKTHLIDIPHKCFGHFLR